MPVILVAFLAPILHALSCIVDAHISNKLFKNYTSILFYNSITNVLVIPFLFLFGTPVLIGWNVVWALLLVAAIDVFYQIPYYSALRKIDTSVVCALFSLAKITIPVMAYFMVGEKLSLLQYLGFGVIILASVFLNLDFSKKIKINQAFGLMLIVSFMLALEAVVFKYILNHLDWVSTLFYTTIFSSSMVFSFLLFKKTRRTIVEDFKSYRKSIKYFLINETLYQSGLLPEIFALSLIPVLVSEGIGATQSIFTLLFGWLLYCLFGDKFKENLSRDDMLKKMICFIFIIAGVILTIG